MRNIIFAVLSFITLLSIECPARRTITVGTYNVDGLPPSLAGITINGDGPAEGGSESIGRKLATAGWDVVALNEDFNYHEQISGSMSGYSWQTYSGGVYASLNAIMGVLARQWRFPADGLQLAVKDGVTVSSERLVAWEADAVCGYMDNDNDSLVTKGFRHYELVVGEGRTLDVVVLHADAGISEGDIRARERGMRQLGDYIMEAALHKPLVVMGDFNCYYDRDRLQELLVDRLDSLAGISVGDVSMEYGIPEKLDKILYINSDDASYRLRLVKAENVEWFVYDDGRQLSDHMPLYATFELTDGPSSADCISEIAAGPHPADGRREERLFGGSVCYDLSGRRSRMTSAASGTLRMEKDVVTGEVRKVVGRR